MIINAYATVHALPALDFTHEPRARRDRGDPELGPHLQGFAGFVMAQGARPMTATRYGVLRHLERVRHHLAFVTEDLAGLERWARAANALLFLEDSTVRAPDGKILVDPRDGEPEPGATLPWPPDAIARKVASEALLAARGVAVAATLPPGIGVGEVELREPRDVVGRIVALFACAVRAEGLGNHDPLPVAVIREKLPLAFEALTPVEQAFMEAEEPDEQDVLSHVWRYEAIVPLAWALGLLAELPFPTEICDVPGLAKLVLSLDAPQLLATAALRPTSEILDALDQTLRAHWAVAEAAVHGNDPPGDLEGGVIAERHHALNWLTRFEEAPWDEVDTPT